MKKWLCFALATLLLLCVGCGKDETDTQQSAADEHHSHSHSDLKVEDCYTFTENKNGTYSYTVEWRGGGVLLTEQEMIRPVSFEVMNEDVLMMNGQAGTGVGARWARFCDIENGRVSDVIGGYLAALDNLVAFVDQRTEAYHVFVCDPFKAYEYTQVVTLEGLVVDGDVIKDFALSKEGILSVTYVTADGDKTATVDLKKE